MLHVTHSHRLDHSFKTFISTLYASATHSLDLVHSYAASGYWLYYFIYYFINAEGIKLILGICCFGWFGLASRNFVTRSGLDPCT